MYSSTDTGHVCVLCTQIKKQKNSVLQKPPLVLRLKPYLQDNHYYYS